MDAVLCNSRDIFKEEGVDYGITGKLFRRG